MDWREMMGVKDKQLPKPYPQYPYNPQKTLPGGNSTDITHGTEENRPHLNPEVQSNTRLFNSKALGRIVEMTIDQRNPNEMFFDEVPYTMDEMRKLKGLDRDDLITAHDLKRIFQGVIQ